MRIPAFKRGSGSMFGSVEQQIRSLFSRVKILEDWASQVPTKVEDPRLSAVTSNREGGSTAGAASGGGGGGGGAVTVSGDVTGTTAATTVERIQGVAVEASAPVVGDILTYDDTTAQWEVRNFTEGNLGVNTTAAPSARLHVGAGTAAASTGPIKLTAGTDLTSPEAGVIEFDGFALEFTPVGTRRYATVTSGHRTATNTVANTTTLTTINSFTVGANNLRVGTTVRFLFLGRYSTASGVDTLNIVARAPGVDVHTITTAAGVVTDAPIYIDWTITCRTTGAGGTGWSFALAEIGGVSFTQTGAATFTLNTTSATFEWRVQWSAAAATNTVSLDQCYMQILG